MARRTKVLAISQGQTCGVAGCDKFRARWDLDLLSTTKHDGARHLAIVNLLGKKIQDGSYTTVVCEMVETMAIQTYESILSCQLCGVIMGVCAAANVDVVCVDPKAVRRFVGGKNVCDLDYMVRRAQEEGERFKDLSVVRAYWLMQYALVKLGLDGKQDEE